MTDKTKPISSSNPPESKGNRTEQVVEQPLVVEKAKKTLLTKDSEQLNEPTKNKDKQVEKETRGKRFPQTTEK